LIVIFTKTFDAMTARLISFIIFCFINTTLAQELILSPHPVENGTRFSFSQSQLKSSNNPSLKNLLDLQINSISVAGSFNQWRKNEYLMNYDSTKGIWFVDIKLKSGIEYHYKFVINDSIWITDPNAPDVTEDEWRNGILIPVDFNSPYVIDVNPPYGKRITQIQTFHLQAVKSRGENSCKLNQNFFRWKASQVYI
jgi:hypothetical protein